MATLHQTNTVNVETTLNDWLRDQIEAISLPAWLPSVTIEFTVQEAALNPPSISIVHIPVDLKGRFQGDNTGVGVRGRESNALMDVSLWVSRSASNWQAQLRTMRALVDQAVVSQNDGGVLIKDYVASASSPATTSYLVRLGQIENVAVSPDPNPDIERIRHLIEYHWILRS